MNREDFRCIRPAITAMTAFRLPPVRCRRLPSGITMVVYDSCDAPVSYLSYVSPGGLSELPSPAYGALISVLRREGTMSLDGACINDLLDYNGAMLKATSGHHYSQVSLRVLNSSLAECLPVFKDLIFNPSFPDEPFAVRREALASNLEVSMGDVDYLATCLSERQIMGADHPGARVDMPDDVRGLTAARLREAFSTIRSLGTLFISGQVDEAVERMVAEVFSADDVACATTGLNIAPFKPMPPGTTGFVAKDTAMQSAVMITLPGPSRHDADYIPLHIAVSALGGYFGSRLMLNIREKLGLTYGISASLLGNADGSYVSIQADTAYGSVDRLCREVAKELDRLSSSPPSGDELERLRQSLLSGQASVLDSPFSVIDYYISAAMSDIPAGYFERKLRAIADLTPGMIAEVAARYLRPELVRTAVAGKKVSRTS